MSILRKSISVLLSITMLMLPVNVIQAKELPNQQRKMADRISKIVIDNYDEYGVLPSVCIGQAFIESTLGQHCSGNNLWGIKSGAESYPTLEAGVKRYLNVINNGCYKGAPFKKDYRKQIKMILDGGYCEPVGNYYSDIVWSIKTYGFDKYDKKLFKKLDEKNTQAKNVLDNDIKPYEPFKAEHNENVKEGIIYSDAETISGGCVMAYNKKKEFIGIYEIVPMNDGSVNGNVIISNIKKLKGKIFLRVFEEAKG